MSNDHVPQHSGSRWEPPATTDPADHRTIPMASLGSATARPDEDRGRRRRRGPLLAVGAVGLSWPLITRLRSGLPTLPRWLTVIVLVIVMVGAVGTLVQVLRIGHSGATAAWSDVA